MIDRIGLLLARWLRRPVTIPDGDGGRVTYYPNGDWSHRT